MAVAALLVVSVGLALPSKSRGNGLTMATASREVSPAATPPPYCGAFTASLKILSPSSAAGPSGTHITLQGAGFYPTTPPDYYVQIWLQSITGVLLDTLYIVPANTSEPFTITFDFPNIGTAGALAPGSYYIWGLNATSPANCADAEFTLTGVSPPGLVCGNWTPQLSITSPTPGTGSAGTTVTLQGSGFRPDNATRLYWANANGSQLSLFWAGNVTTNSSGGFSGANAVVPRGFAAGPYFFWGWVNLSPYFCAGAEFNLTGGGPNISLTPDLGPLGTSVTVSGSGFSLSDTVVNISGKALLFTLPCVLSSGGIVGNCSFEADGGLAGPQTITAVGNVVGGPADTATATLTVYPSLVLSPVRGPAGSTFTISGLGFSAFPSAADVTFDGRLLSPTGGSDCRAGSSGTLITLDALGYFSCSFTVPPWATSGSNDVQGDDTFTGELTAGQMFLVTTGGPSISLSPEQGPLGALITVSGSGFSSTDTGVNISGEPVFIPVPCRLSGGSISGGCTFRVGAGGLAGPETLSATGNVVGGAADTATASLTVYPSLSPSPSTGPIGSTFTVVGLGFSAFPAGANVSFDGRLLAPTGGQECRPGTTGTTITLEALGDFSCTFTVPAWATLGANSLQGNDTYTGELSASQTFSVTSGGPSIALTPDNGPPGANVVATGSGFSAADTEVSLSGVPLFFPVSCPVSGGTITGTCSFGVSNGALAGPQSITAVGNVDSDEAMSTFTVQPSLALSPSRGPVGSSFTVSGYGFSASPAQATISWGGQLLAPTGGSACQAGSSRTLITLEPLGYFSCTFTVPGWATLGSNALQGNDTLTGELTAEQVFTATSGVPRLTLTPAQGPPGTTVVVSGSGFSPTDSGVNISGEPVFFPLACLLSSGTVTGGCSFQVSAAGLAGPETVAAVGNVVGGAGDTGTAALTVYPNLTLSLDQAPTGTSFTITGAGFSAGPSAADVTFDGRLLAPTGGPDCPAGTSATLITLEPLGRFSCTFTVPAWANVGSNRVQGYDTFTSEVTAEEVVAVTTPRLTTVSSTTGAPGPMTFSLTGLAPDTVYDVFLDTSPRVASGASYDPLGACTSTSGGSLTNCSVSIPSGLAPGTYYVDLFQDPAPLPFIFSVLSFTVNAPPSSPTLLGLNLAEVEGIGAVVGVALITLGVVVVVRRKRLERNG